MREMQLATVVVHATTREPLALLADADRDTCVVVSVRGPQADVLVQGPHTARDDDTRMIQDLVADVLDAVGRRVARAEVTDLVDGRFHAVLVLDDDTRVRGRPSDVLAIAVRDDRPILVADHVVETAGQSFSELWGNRPTPPHEQVVEMRRFLDEATADDFDQPPEQDRGGPATPG